MNNFLSFCFFTPSGSNLSYMAVSFLNPFHNYKARLILYLYFIVFFFFFQMVTCPGFIIFLFFHFFAAAFGPFLVCLHFSFSFQSEKRKIAKLCHHIFFTINSSFAKARPVARNSEEFNWRRGTNSLTRGSIFLYTWWCLWCGGHASAWLRAC